MLEDKDILKLIHNELSVERAQEVRQAIDASPKATRLFKQYSYVYDNRDIINQVRTLSVRDEWSALSKKLGIQNNTSSSSSTGLWIVLALLLLGIAAGMYFYLKPGPYITQQADIAGLEIILPDGSIARIDENTTITYKRDMSEDSVRLVTLIGKGTFDVVSDPDKPFIVQSEGAGIKVLGTIFNIEPQPGGAMIENEEGLINCFDLRDTTSNVTLNEGDKALWDGSSFEYIPKYVPPPPRGSDVRIDNFIDRLSDRYPSRVEFSPYLPYDSRTIFVEMDQSLDEIMTQIDTSANVDVQQVGNRYIILGLSPKN